MATGRQTEPVSYECQQAVSATRGGIRRTDLKQLENGEEVFLEPVLEMPQDEVLFRHVWVR